MPNFIDQLGQTTAATAVNGALGMGMGLMLEKHNDQRQINQQQKLQDMQIAGQQKMMQSQYDQQMKMWNATNYSAQMEQLKKAGLNPGLIYGEGGGGGATVATGQGSVNGADAPRGGGEIIAQQGMGLQLAQQQAQIELLKAQANNLNVDSKKKAGVDTTLGETQIESLTQGIQNQKAVEALTKTETALNKWEINFKNATTDEQIGILTEEFRKITGEANSAMIQGNLDEFTKQNKQKIMDEQAIGAVLQNTLTQANINATNEQITKWANEIQQGWTNLSIQEKNMKINGIMAEVNQIYAGALGKLRSHNPEQVAQTIDKIIGISSNANINKSGIIIGNQKIPH